MKKNHSKIDHVELLKAYNISLSYCTVHIVRWNIMWNVYFFLMASRMLTVSDFQAECPLNKTRFGRGRLQSHVPAYIKVVINVHICSF